MEQIRIRRGIEIGVNDNGDSIFIDMESMNFIQRYQALVERVQLISDSIDTSKDLSENDGINLVVDKMKEILEGLDDLFGENASAKVFGVGIVPTPMAVIDFFDQISPIVKKYSDERERKIMEKYVARKGGHKKKGEK